MMVVSILSGEVLWSCTGAVAMVCGGKEGDDDGCLPTFWTISAFRSFSSFRTRRSSIALRFAWIGNKIDIELGVVLVVGDRFFRVWSNQRKGPGH